MGSDGKRGCFKLGCVGCVGVGGVLLLIAVVLVGLTVLTSPGEERIEPVDLSQRVPFPEIAERPPGSFEIPQPGRVILDVTNVQLSVVPGPAGESIRVDGRYDAAAFKLDQSYEPEATDEGWTYRLSFRKRGLGLLQLFSESMNTNRLRLTLPRDTPMVLQGRIGIGESELELGGLWLVGTDLELGVGEHDLGFDEPLPFPMDGLQLDGSIGEIRLRSVGNASPSSVRVSQSIGETQVDLDGAWSRDADVWVRCGIGECRIRVPPEVGVIVENAGVLIGESDTGGLRNRPPSREGAPTLTLAVSGKLGEVSIDH